MTAKFGDKGEYRKILKIDFADNAEYKKFVKNLAECVVEEIQFNDELAVDIAYELVERHLPKLAEAVLGRLVSKLQVQS